MEELIKLPAKIIENRAIPFVFQINDFANKSFLHGNVDVSIYLQYKYAAQCLSGSTFTNMLPCWHEDYISHHGLLQKGLMMYLSSQQKGRDEYNEVWKLIRFDYGEFEQITPPVFGAVFRSILRINYPDFRI